MPDPEEQKESETLANPEYERFLKTYRDKGFEIALHTVSAGHDSRSATLCGYERFREVFGRYPEINIMHSKNRENIYWGRNVSRNPVMRLLIGFYDRTEFEGEKADSPYYWGDLCRRHTKYVRRWGTSDINTLKYNPSMPYHDPAEPLVRYWFSFSDGYKMRCFKKLLSPAGVRRLAKERGACIVYTHFAAGFCRKQDGRYVLDPGVREALRGVRDEKEGWFVPAGMLLDRLLLIKNVSLLVRGSAVCIHNRNEGTVLGVTLVTRPGLHYRDAAGIRRAANEEGEILIGELAAGEWRTISVEGYPRAAAAAPQAPDVRESLVLLRDRALIMLFEHRG